MATVTKFNDFSDQLIRGVHDFDAHVFKVALTNTAPTAANTTLADITQIATGNGYAAGGSTTTITVSETAGTTTVTGTTVTFTATGGAMGPFRYYVIYNDSATAPADALIQFYDHGSSVTLQPNDQFVINWNNTPATGTILTLA